MKNRMRESRSFGSVRGEGSDVLAYSESQLGRLESRWPGWGNFLDRPRRAGGHPGEFAAYRPEVETGKLLNSRDASLRSMSARTSDHAKSRYFKRGVGSR